ncbi:hypothetical protein K438DRAFT_1782633 [Mycena galopus ATCC 62051]|nr:hypothetical protein K438DRAFT_1782633 [Mycena galopus ATCC 62051]
MHHCAEEAEEEATDGKRRVRVVHEYCGEVYWSDGRKAKTHHDYDSEQNSDLRRLENDAGEREDGISRDDQYYAFKLGRGGARTIAIDDRERGGRHRRRSRGGLAILGQRVDGVGIMFRVGGEPWLIVIFFSSLASKGERKSNAQRRTTKAADADKRQIPVAPTSALICVAVRCPWSLATNSPAGAFYLSNTIFLHPVFSVHGRMRCFRKQSVSVGGRSQTRLSGTDRGQSVGLYDGDNVNMLVEVADLHCAKIGWNKCCDDMTNIISTFRNKQ